MILVNVQDVKKIDSIAVRNNANDTIQEELKILINILKQNKNKNYENTKKLVS